MIIIIRVDIDTVAWGGWEGPVATLYIYKIPFFCVKDDEN